MAENAVNDLETEKERQERREFMGDIMKKWKTPRIRMISVGCEINAYACADI